MLTDKQILNHLKKQKIETDNFLWDSLGQELLEKKPAKEKNKSVLEPLRQIRYRTDREIIAAGGHICANCRYKNHTTGECTSRKFKDENDAVIECIAENYKYWESIDED